MPPRKTRPWKEAKPTCADEEEDMRNSTPVKDQTDVFFNVVLPDNIVLVPANIFNSWKWSPLTRDAEFLPDGSLKSKGWAVGVLDLPNSTEVTLTLEIKNGTLNQIAMISPSDDYYTKGSQCRCGLFPNGYLGWGDGCWEATTLHNGDNVREVSISNTVSIVLSRRKDSETTCSVTCERVTTVLRGFPLDHLLAVGFYSGNTVCVTGLVCGWLRRRGYLLLVHMSLLERATGGTETAALLATDARLPWDIVEYVFQWI